MTGARPASRHAGARVLVVLMSLVLTACVTRVVQLNARYNAQQAVREADRLMRHGHEDSARVLYAQAAAAAKSVLESETLTPAEQLRWRYLGGRAVAYSADCVEAQRVLGDALDAGRLPALDELEGRIAFAACLLREGHVSEGRGQLQAFDTARFAALPRETAHDARQRLTLWTMRLLLHENDDEAVDVMHGAFGAPPRAWEPNAALYDAVQRERVVGPFVHALRQAHDTLAMMHAIAELDTITIASARVARLREGTDRLQLLLGTTDPSGAAAYHAGDVAMDMLGNPHVALALWVDASRRYPDSPLVAGLLWRASLLPIADAAAVRDTLLARFPQSPEAARTRGDTAPADSPAAREQEELLRSRWELMERALAEQRASARTPDDG